MVRDFGSWSAIDHASHNTEDLERAVIRLAEDLGWAVEPAVYLELAALLPHDSPLWDEDPEQAAQTLGWFHDEAVDYLNEHACPDGYVWEHDGHAGAFGCWRITEDYLP
jgi:hypothetical protein